jgi:Peptidase family M48
MLATSISLAVLAFALAWPVPVVLSHAKWPSRAPATALLLWQSIALAGGLSMIGSLLCFGLIPFGDDLVSATAALVRSFIERPLVSSVEVIHLVSLCGGVLLGIHLVLNLILTVAQTQRQRQRHRQLVQLLSSPLPNQPHTRLLDHAVPVAYCLPGTYHSVTVFSAGLVQLLDTDELQAVIEHEKAHLTQRHYIVLMAFDAWRSSLPWFPTATRAQRQVGTLVEMLADDYARRLVDDRTLATAIALVAVGGEESARGSVDIDSLRLLENRDSAGPSDAQLEARVARLLDGHPPLSVAARLVVAVVGLAFLAVPTVLLLLPGVTSLA